MENEEYDIAKLTLKHFLILNGLVYLEFFNEAPEIPNPL